MFLGRTVCLILLTAFNAAAAQRYALLIGIGRYIPGQKLKDLDGPVKDVDEVERALKTKFEYSPENMRVLRDEQASKARILNELDALIARVRPGDYFFFYYSGHGTSPQDLGSRDLAMSIDTGALFPADFRSGSPKEVNERLIVGQRDLKPRFQLLDGKATVFGVLDTCFSANLMRSVKPRGKPKSVPLSEVTGSTRSMEDSIASELKQYEDAVRKEPPQFPYRSVAWISAARAGQQAVDIDKEMLAADRNATVDGNPHGVLTNALLKGLTGLADRNHDGTITHDEMYEFLERESKDWSHQPVWSANEQEKAIPNMPLFGVSGRTGTAVPTRFSGKVRVQLEGGASVLASQLSGVSGIELVSSQPDLTVRPDRDGYLVYQAGGVPIIGKPVSAGQAVARIVAEPNVRRLTDWNYPQQRLNVELTAWRRGQRLQEGFLFPSHGEGDPNNVWLKMQSSATVWPLIVDIDVEGVVTVLYPNPKHVESVPAGAMKDLGENNVSCPCGIEFIKAFVFDRKPEAWESWTGQQFAPGTALLEKLLATVASGAGETTIRLISQDLK